MFATMSDQQRGAAYGVTAYLIWGFAALYWVQTEPVDPRDLLAHRALWSVPFVFVCLLFRDRLKAALAVFKQPRVLGIMAIAAALSGTNWLVFLWAISNGQATEASLGYFLLPLLNVVIGLTLFGERVDRAQQVGIAFAVAAVLLQIFHRGGLPLVSLGLACTFGLYGAIRKKVSVSSLEGLFIETLMMSPLALYWMHTHEWAGLGAHGLRVDMFLLGAGAMTAIPLISYVASSRLLPLTALGLIFYIGPTAQLLVALLIFKEPFDLVQGIAFGLVWCGLAFVTVDGIRRSRKRRAHLDVNRRDS
ncbi:hypothetical protein BST95_09530 [Halioglobus japonicus]|uniref:EamA family transporter RarD n=1 Tax=Halioglobus japonicus TaxID=930805 RepID=A0AAP8MEN8_9GAMM|nr:EamA family transporter RarD [Halioglobus japonicus]AQA18441.1 hypothetical protein BST95_09530 [Halioglobus japonicus]PLW86455.1 EamA family transporter RarD [Halioglobus japonicus]GHD12758.1 transporter [Halioglobus japonicus]